MAGSACEWDRCQLTWTMLPCKLEIWSFRDCVWKVAVFPLKGYGSTKGYESSNGGLFFWEMDPLDAEFITCDFCVYWYLLVNGLGDKYLYILTLVQGANWSMILLFVNVKESLLFLIERKETIIKETTFECVFGFYCTEILLNLECNSSGRMVCMMYAVVIWFPQFGHGRFPRVLLLNFI